MTGRGSAERGNESDTERGTETGTERGTPCPICGRPAQAAFRPFCSQRCADVDLGRWLGERYVIPDPARDTPRDPDENGRA